MTEFQIIGKRWDNETDQVVTHVKLNETADCVRTIEEVIGWIEAEKHSFYTLYGVMRAKVRVATHPSSNKKFLISTADGIHGNNIDNLLDC